MKITIDSKWCKGCALCGYLMPYAQNPDACIACKMCERTCPDVCIEVTKE